MAPIAWPPGSTASRIDERRAQRRQIDLEFIAGLRPDAIDEAQGRRAEEVQVHVARNPVLPVLEVVVLEIGETVAHVAFTRQEGLLPQHLAVAADAAGAFEVRRQLAGVEHGSDAALPQFRVRQQ